MRGLHERGVGREVLTHAQAGRALAVTHHDEHLVTRGVRVSVRVSVRVRVRIGVGVRARVRVRARVPRRAPSRRGACWCR